MSGGEKEGEINDAENVDKEVDLVFGADLSDHLGESLFGRSAVF